MNIDYNIIKDIIQLTSNIAILVGFIWAIIQFYISQWTKSINKAIELTLFYKNNILDVFPIINYVYEECNLTVLLERVDFQKVKDFDINELYNYYTKDEIEKFTNYIDDKDFNKTLIEVCRLFPFSFDGIDITKDNTNNRILVSCEPIKTKQSYMALLSNIMNNLEYFATNFNKNIANKNSIYQVIHQSFIKTVELLYAEISLSNNDVDEFKYYTNIIELYKIWKRKSTNKQKKINSTKNKLNNKINSIIK